MPEERGLYPRMPVGEQVAYFGRIHGLSAAAARAATRTWLGRLDLGDRARAKLDELSHGNQQRVQLAAALVHDARPARSRRALLGPRPGRGQNARRGATRRSEARHRRPLRVHQLDLVEDICEDVAIIDHGHVVATGGLDDLRRRSRRRLIALQLEGAPSEWLTAHGGRRTARTAKWQPSPVRRPRRRAGAGAGRRRASGARDRVQLPAALACRAIPRAGRRDERRQTISLVAWREIHERLRSRVFLYSTLLMLVVVGASSALPAFIDTTKTYRVAVLEPAPRELDVALRRAAQPFAAKVKLQVLPAAAAREQLKTSKIDALLVLSSNRIAFHDNIDPKLAAITDNAVRAVRRHLPPAPELTPVTIETSKAKSTDAEVLTAMLGASLLLATIAVYGQWVLTGVVEEKANRVVEVIVAAVRPRHLLAGKVIGIGLLGLAQVTLTRRPDRDPPRRRGLPRPYLAQRERRARRALVRTRIRPVCRRIRRCRRNGIADARRQLSRHAGDVHAPRRVLPRLRRPLGRRQQCPRTPTHRLPTHSATRPASANRPRRRAGMGARTRGRCRSRDDLRARPPRRTHLRRRAPALRPAPRPTRSNPARATSLRKGGFS